MKALRKTKIVGTIGPASENKLEELFDAGLNVCRINYSHGSWDEQCEKSETIMKIREEKELPIPMLLDMKGPEIRTGMLYTGKNKKIEYEVIKLHKISYCYKNLIFILHLIKMLNKVNYDGKIKTDTK